MRESVHGGKERSAERGGRESNESRKSIKLDLSVPNLPLARSRNTSRPSTRIASVHYVAEMTGDNEHHSRRGSAAAWH